MELQFAWLMMASNMWSKILGPVPLYVTWNLPGMLTNNVSVQLIDDWGWLCQSVCVCVRIYVHLIKFQKSMFNYHVHREWNHETMEQKMYNN